MSSTAPIPGRPVRGSRSGRPIMAAFDLLGRRWMLSILWEMRLGRVRFTELRRRLPEVAPATLSLRLAEAEAASLVVGDGRGYRLTALGRGLIVCLGPLELWAHSWAARVGVDGDSDREPAD